MKKNDYLEHYGVIGMKWYQHKFGKVDGRAKYDQKYKDKEVKKVQRSVSRAKSFNKIFGDEKSRKIIEKQGQKEIDRIMAYSHNDILWEVDAVSRRNGQKVALTMLGFIPIASNSRFKEEYRTGTTTHRELQKYRRGW